MQLVHSLMTQGVGNAVSIAKDCAVAIHEPVATAEPCVRANTPPVTGPSAPRPAMPRTYVEPNVTPTTSKGDNRTAVTRPILIRLWLGTGL